MRVGEFLRKLRETKGITIEKVRKNTHITPKYIEALENSNYTGFLSEVYQKGYLKLYAEYLGVVGKELDVLVGHFEKELRKWQANNKNDKNITLSKFPKKFFVVLTLLPLGIFLFLFHSGVLSAVSKKEEISDRLSLEVETVKSTWVEIDREGVVEWTRLHKGDKILWTANNLLKIKVGDPSAVYIKFNGKPLNFLNKLSTPIELTCENPSQ